MRTRVLLMLAVITTLQPPPSRIVSLIPALTDMLIAMGGRAQLVAVSSYDDDPQVKGLPRVGALLDPDVERIIALRPDLVLVYASQQDLVTQLSRASIRFYQYRHGGLAQVTGTIRDLGSRVGRAEPANALADSIDKQILSIHTRVSSSHKPRTLLVFGRESGTLRGIYASGGRGFLHDMLEAAGGTNVFADTTTESVQASSELILARSPDVIIELRSKEESSSASANVDAPDLEAWRALSSVPAVRNRRVHVLSGKSVNVPGPLVADGVERLARLLHPDVFK